MIKDLRKDEYSDFYQTYIDALPKEHVGLIENLNFSKKEALALLTKLAEDKHEYVYAEGKWTIKEILLHIIDDERIFAYRAPYPMPARSDVPTIRRPSTLQRA